MVHDSIPGGCWTLTRAWKHLEIQKSIFYLSQLVFWQFDFLFEPQGVDYVSMIDKLSRINHHRTLSNDVMMLRNSSNELLY
jgi:hypothetical protein